MRKISLKAARINAGFTQKNVAEIVKISNKTLGNWENGTTAPNVEQAGILCKLYGVTIDEINFLPESPLKAN